jgi:hypothetical protein
VLPYVGLLRRTLPADRPNQASAGRRSCVACRGNLSSCRSPGGLCRSRSVVTRLSIVGAWPGSGALYGAEISVRNFCSLRMLNSLVLACGYSSPVSEGWGYPCRWLQKVPDEGAARFGQAGEVAVNRLRSSGSQGCLPVRGADRQRGPICCGTWPASPPIAYRSGGRAGRPEVPSHRPWTGRSSAPCRRTCSSPRRPCPG